MSATITQDIIDQAETIRAAGPVNMMDQRGVQYHADQMEMYGLVVWIEDNPKDYMNLLQALGTNMSDHLWVEDGERIVCTHCGITLDKEIAKRWKLVPLKEGGSDECPDNE